MRMYNYEVENFLNFLMAETLAGKQSRMRTKFVKLAAERLDEIEKDRVEVIKEFSEKLESGEPVVVTNEEGNSSYKIADMEGFNREYNILMKEEFIIDENTERQDMLATVKNIVLNTESTFSGQEALQYDRYCEIVESE